VVALYLVSLGTVPFAEATRIQLYTFVLIVLFTVLVKSCLVLFQRADPQQLLASEQFSSSFKL